MRFGAYYVYVPQSLKPGARALALQLWSLRLPDASGEETARTLLPLASSGRTSLPVDPSISKDGYRVAGFRPCGERVVRVDIVERLSDMIRAAFVACSPSDGAPSTGSAFVVSGQMTSLTGCSGETFASILRSLGYESFEIERSRLARPQIAVKPGPADAPPSVAASVAEASATEAERPVGGDAAEVGAPEAAACRRSVRERSGAAGRRRRGRGRDGRGRACRRCLPRAKKSSQSGGDAPDVAADVVHGPDDEAGRPGAGCGGRS